MVTLPIFTFYWCRSNSSFLHYLLDYLTSLWIDAAFLKTASDRDVLNYENQIGAYSALGAVISVQVIIFGVILIKYTEDILAVFVYDKGHIPYEG